MHSSHKKGFTLLYAVLVVGALMSLVFAVLNITYKQAALSNLNKNSGVAYYAADSGLECGRYWSDYGAFNPSNPVNPFSTFSTIDCLGNTTITPSVVSSATLSNPILLNSFTDLGFPFPVNPYSFQYSLANAYKNSVTPLLPQATVNIWQNASSTPDPTNTSFLTTAILSTGANTANTGPTQVQRGVGQDAAVTQCLASAFAPTSTSGGYSNGLVPSFSTDLDSYIAPFFPGISLNALSTKAAAIYVSKVGNIGNIGNSAWWYIWGGGATHDAWDFTPVNPPITGAALTLTANVLKAPNTSGENYQFGFYPDGNPGGFQPLAQSDNGTKSINIPSQIPANEPVEFAMEITNDSDNSQVEFLSTNVSDDAYGGTVTGDTIPHMIIFSTPIPMKVDDSNNNTANHLSGKYIFAFDTGQNPSTFDSAIFTLQLVGCP